MNEPITEPPFIKGAVDPIVNRVMQSFSDRASLGFRKYGMTTMGNPLDLHAWLQHLKEEMMDSIVYIERTQEEIRRINLVKVLSDQS